MSESEKPPEIVPAPSRLLTPGQWLYRTAGEALRLAGPAGKEPTSLVQILATTWKRSPQQIQELTEAYRRLSAWSWRVCLLPKDFGILPKTGVYLTFPLRGGKLLRQLVGTQQHVYSLEQAVQLLTPLAEALDRGHAAGLLHLSVAPTQIIVGKSLGDCSLLDFGLRSVVLSQDVDRDRALDRDRWSFWAPEISAREPAAPATDQFALASLAFLLLSGRFLIDAPSVTAAAFECHNRLSSAVTQLEPALQPVFQRAFAMHPRDRYPDCASLVAELAAAMPPPAQAVGRNEPADVAEVPLDIDADYDVLTDFDDPAGAPDFISPVILAEHAADGGDPSPVLNQEPHTAGATIGVGGAAALNVPGEVSLPAAVAATTLHRPLAPTKLIALDC